MADPKIARAVWTALHGMYGNRLLDTYRTGRLEADGKTDKGVAEALRLWGSTLAGVDPAHIPPALAACSLRHKEWPPTLPQFLELVRAAEQAARPPVAALPRPAIDEATKAEIHARVRTVLAKGRVAAAAAPKRPTARSPGLPDLLALCANAIGLAGGDEVAALLKLERELLGADALLG